MVGVLGHVGTYLAAESTASKRPSNGAPQMRADGVLKGACLSRPVGFLCLFSHTFSGQATMSLGRGGESVAPVFLEASANNQTIVDSCAGGVGSWVSKAFPSRVRYVRCCRLLQGPGCCQSYARHTSHGASADLSHFGKLLEGSVQWRSARSGPQRKIYRVLALLDRQIEPVSDVVLCPLRPSDAQDPGPVMLMDDAAPVRLDRVCPFSSLAV